MKTKAVLFLEVSIGIAALTGCFSSPHLQGRTDQPSLVPTLFASPVATPIPPTNTATVMPTASIPAPTTTARSTPPLAPAVSSTIFEEGFLDNRNDWYTDATLATIGNGIYAHKLDCPEVNASPHCGSFIRIPFTFPRNFRMEINATVVKASAGAEVIVAFEVRRKAEYYYLEYFLMEGGYQISRISQYGIFRIVPENSTDFTVKTVGEINRLGVIMKDTSLTPLINGHELAPAQDGKIPNAGDSYLVVLVDRGHSAELQFGNLTVQEVK